MAYFSIRASSFSSLILLFLLFAKPYSTAKVVDVNVICSKARDPSFCSNTLNSKPGGAQGADIITLAKYTVDVARAKATDTLNLINNLIAKSGSDPNAKAHYSNCLTHFDKDEGALSDIDRVQQLLKKGDYVGVNIAASAVITDADDCVNGEGPSDPSFSDTSNLPQSADVVKKVASIILVISNLI